MSRSAHAIMDDFARSSMNCPPRPALITTTAAMEARIAGVCVRSLRYTTNSCGTMRLGKDGPPRIARRARRALAMLELSLSGGGGEGRISSSCSHMQSRMHMRGSSDDEVGMPIYRNCVESDDHRRQSKAKRSPLVLLGTRVPRRIEESRCMLEGGIELTRVVG